jgi:hypothetical protein
MKELDLLAWVQVYVPQANDGLNAMVQAEVYFILQMEAIEHNVHCFDEQALVQEQELAMEYILRVLKEEEVVYFA